jgi:DMSO/TMAO reductase YedYZ molybdopterin-dependent catalytic subunit
VIAPLHESVTQTDSRHALWGSFSRGFSAGLITLVLWFLVRLGGLAPFPPESVLGSFLTVIPESLQEPAVQNLGEMAGLLGLAVAVLVAAAVYGALGIVYERYYLPRLGGRNSLSRLENTLVYSLIPWILFGVVVLPLTGVSFFGVGSDFASPSVVWAFPLTMLLFQFLWGVLLWGRTQESLLSAPGTSAAVEKLVPRDPARRTFIERTVVMAGSAVLVLASLGSALGTLASEGGIIGEGSSAILPGTSINLQDAPAIFLNPQLSALVNSEVTSNDSFYRVAIDIFDPSVDAASWALSLTGLVANPKSYTIDEIKNLQKVEQYDTFICVSNLINGGLISNAKWGGVRISDLLADAGGASSAAKYVVFYSVDGYSVGVPLARALDPSSMLAYEMNGATLPQRHGYPLRAVIPGLYGMMSAKWVRQVELSDSVYLGFWQTRGWSNDAAVQTVAFIRVPADGATVSLSQSGGSVVLGGVAFAGDRGISKVEVSVDGGSTWQAATLKPPASDLTWVLWAFEWNPKPGDYTIYARATDGQGALQTSAQADTFPSGATGYVMSTVNVVS